MIHVHRDIGRAPRRGSCKGEALEDATQADNQLRENDERLSFRFDRVRSEGAQAEYGEASTHRMTAKDGTMSHEDRRFG
jgi:hypothetical protein